jgi:hypothetical protein
MVTYRQPFLGEWPITQRYGEIVPGVTYNNAPHTGIDYGCPEGTEILASAAGVVMYCEFDNYGFGNTVIIQHNDGKATLYAHLKQIRVVMRQKLEQGEVIGLSGSTGKATGPHLHFEARSRWSDYRSHQNPITFLPLTSFADNVPPQLIAVTGLKDADTFAEGDVLTVTAPLGAKAFFRGFDSYTVYPIGSRFYYTGESTAHNGFTYLQVIPLQFPVWIAVHDHETQILDRSQ